MIVSSFVRFFFLSFRCSVGSYVPRFLGEFVRVLLRSFVRLFVGSCVVRSFVHSKQN